MKTMKILSAIFVLSLILSPFLCATKQNITPKLPQKKTEQQKIEEKKGVKDDFTFHPAGDVYQKPRAKDPKIKFKKRNVKFVFGGTVKYEAAVAKNPVFLNKHIPDGYEFFKQTADFTLDLLYGKETFGYDAIEFFTDIRHKATWGNSGKAVETVGENVKFDDIVISKHSHLSKQPLIWIRSLWLQLSMNALLNQKGTHHFDHYLKFGLFPFSLGRGIALGTIYGQKKDFIGIYSGYQNDQHAPGINLHGDLIKDVLDYDIYYAKLEEKGASINDTLNHVKAQLRGRELTPWRGVSKDNDLVAIRMTYKPFKGKNLGTLELEPYMLYNEASDREIEVEADSKNSLGTLGLMIEYEWNNFEIGGEIATNCGNTQAYELDRNVREIVNNDDGIFIEQYTHVLDANGNKAVATNNNITLVNASSNTQNSEAIGGGLTNSSNRFRNAYKIKYRGWMAVIDAAYTVEQNDFKVAAAFGFASGDENPHATDTDKKYHGWVGLQEGYAGKRVPSAFVLDARKLKRPLTINKDFDRASGEDDSFTDMIYLGFGLTWFPLKHDVDYFSFSPNVLLYWKDDTSKKYDVSLNNGQGGFTEEDADDYLGTEFNFSIKYKPLNNIQLFGDFAIFFPGKYYRDVQGVPLRNDIFKDLDVEDETGKESLKYRLGNDTSWMFNLGLVYKF